MFAIVGQERALRIVSLAVQSGRPAHAYLFAGPADVGKQTLALQLAQALNCREADPPCGQCSSCRRIAEAKHPDVQLVTVLTNKEDRRTKNISIAQVREVEQTIALKPYEGGYRVVIIDPADAMNLEAQNSFLKTLEEPPPNTVLILITTREHLLLETIRSRCARVEFGLAPREVIRDLLAERGQAPEQAELLSRLAEGRVGLALAYAADSDLLAARSEGLASARELARTSLPDRFQLADALASSFSSEAAAIHERLGHWRSWWRDVLLLQTQGEDGVSNADFLAQLMEDAGRTTPGEVAEFLRALDRCDQYLDFNINPRLALEALLLATPAA